jgi:hypothetical protein
MISNFRHRAKSFSMLNLKGFSCLLEVRKNVKYSYPDKNLLSILKFGEQ